MPSALKEGVPYPTLKPSHFSPVFLKPCQIPEMFVGVTLHAIYTYIYIEYMYIYMICIYIYIYIHTHTLL